MKLSNILLLLLAGLLTHTVTAQLLTDSLVLNMPMNGNADDFSGYHNNGVIHNAVADTNRFGDQNSSYRFNGVNSYIEIPASPSLNQIQKSDVISISAWINIFNWHSSGNVFSIFERYNTTTDAGWLFEANWASGGILFLADETSPTNYVGCNYTWNFHQWHHLCLTYDRTLGIARFYVDNEQVCANPFSASINVTDTTAPFVIGRSLAGPDEYSDGLIDDYKIYNRVLTPQEIDVIYTTEIKNPEKENRFSFYPNPVTDKLFVKTRSDQQASEYTLSDALGRKKITGTLSQDDPFINLGNLSPGVYFLHLPGGKSQVYRIVR